MKKILSVLGSLFCLFYLFNPGAGVIEIIPDNIPGIGNVDEVSVTLLLVYCLANLGIHLPLPNRFQPSATTRKKPPTSEIPPSTHSKE